MRAFVIAIVLPVVLVGPAQAFQCPLLVKQLTDQVAKLPAGDARVKKAQPLIDEARKLHAEGSHAKSIAAADEAARALGITLNKQ